MQPVPEPNQPPAEVTNLPTEPLVSPWQGVAGARSLTPLQPTTQPDPGELPPLPMKPGHQLPTVEPQEIIETQETTEVETIYSAEVDAPLTPRQRRRRTDKTIRFVLAVIEVLLLLRLFLKLIGANPASPFGIFLFGLTDPLAAPFDTLLPNPIIGKSMIEFTTILALIIYPVFGWIIGRSLQLVFYHELGGRQVVHKRRRIDHEGS